MKRLAPCLLVLAGCSGNAKPHTPAPSDLGTELAAPPMNVRQVLEPSWTGSEFVVAWIGYAVDEALPVHLVRISRAGELLAPAHHAGDIRSLGDDGVGQVFQSAGGYVGFMFEGSWIEVGQFSSAGDLLADDFTDFIDGTSSAFRVDLRAGRFDLAATVDTGGTSKVQLQSFSEDLTPLGAAVAVDATPASQWDVNMSWSASHSSYVVAWLEADVDDRIRWTLWDPTREPLASELVLDNGHGQSGPAVLADTLGNLLLRWRQSGDDDRTWFFYRSSAGAIWPGARTLFPENRIGESQDIGWAHIGDTVRIAWQANDEYALPQIYTGVINPAAGETELSAVEMLTDGNYPFTDPSVTAGDGVFLITYKGAVDGSERLYFRVRAL